MSRLQKWFEQLTGTTAADRQRVDRMRELYGRRLADATLEMPACWRRKPRLSQATGR